MKIAYVIIGAVVLAVLAGAGGFFGGMTYAQSQAQNTASDFARQRAIQGGQGNGSGGATAAAGPCGFGGFGGFQGNGGQGAQGGAPSGTGQTNQTGGQGTGQGTRRQGTGGPFGGGNPFGGAGFAGSCVARGQIKSVDGNTVQISTADSVVTVKVNDSTIISKTDRGTISDLQVGDRVTVFSQETGDSPTASGIQLQPAPPATATP